MSLTGASEHGFVFQTPDWGHVTVKKRDLDGTLVEKPFRYLMEKSTGDLYGIQGTDPPTRSIVAIKSAAICVGSLFYPMLVVAWKVMSFFADLTELGLNAPAAFSQKYSTKGFVVAITEVGATAVCTSLHSLAELVAGCAKIPFYATALFFASLYGILIPFEGMKWISKIESQWHEGATYQSDIRYNNVGWLSPTIIEDFKAARAGKVLFLAYCMQKRGNLFEEVNGTPRYTLIKKPS